MRHSHQASPIFAHARPQTAASAHGRVHARAHVWRAAWHAATSTCSVSTARASLLSHSRRSGSIASTSAASSRRISSPASSASSRAPLGSAPVYRYRSTCHARQASKRGHGEARVQVARHLHQRLTRPAVAREGQLKLGRRLRLATALAKATGEQRGQVAARSTAEQQPMRRHGRPALWQRDGHISKALAADEAGEVRV